MKLTEIQIDRCGIWRHLTLPVRPHGMSVFIGPNEAGKSTLQRFVRGVLFGFPGVDEDWSKDLIDGVHASGSLELEDDNESFRVHRSAAGELAGAPRLILGERAIAHEEKGLVNSPLQERLFDRLFALNLRELNEISALSGDEVSDHVFGLSLGVAGRQLMRAVKRIDSRRRKLHDAASDSGDLVDLFRRRQEVTRQLAELDSLRQRHTEWCLRRDQLEAEIGDLRRRHQLAGDNLRGYEYLERVWGPWNRVRECQVELDRLPEVRNFPDRGIERLDRIENELAGATATRQRVRAEIKTVREQLLHPTGLTEWQPHSAALRGLVEQRTWLASIEQRYQEASHHLTVAESECQLACEPLGPEWNVPRLQAIESAAHVERKLVGVAESLRSAERRRERTNRSYKRLRSILQERRDELQESLHDLEERSIDEATEQARQRLADLNQLTAVRLREQQLTNQLALLETEYNRANPEMLLPNWVHFVLGVFAFSGVVLAGWGLLAGVVTSGIAGVIYALLGISTGGMAWGLKVQFEREARNRLESIANSILSLRREIDALRASLPAQINQLSLDDIAEAIVDAQDEVAELAQLASRKAAYRKSRKKLERLKKHKASALREVETAKLHWRKLLEAQGIPLSKSIDGAIAFWRQVALAAEKISQWKSVRSELSLFEELRSQSRQKIADLARRLPQAEQATSDPFELLCSWEEQLARIDRVLTARRELKIRYRHLRRETTAAEKQISEFRLKRNALLAQGGAANREEFEHRSHAYARRSYLADQLESAQRNLDSVCASPSELAIAEEDLLRYNAADNSRKITDLRHEISELDGELELTFEHLGGIKREIEALENDPQPTYLRLELSQLEATLRMRSREWVVCEAAAKTIDGLVRDFERTHQPTALAETCRLFSRLTCGKYTHVWAPLGTRRLIVGDDAGNSFPIQALSQAAREQLLLAVRLAVISELGRQGTTFPIMLDDVLVNFDESRAQAAADVLVELAERGQQILFFTCHIHLAQLFERRGIALTRLPAHGPALISNADSMQAG